MNRWLVGATAIVLFSAPAIMTAATRTGADVTQTTASSDLTSSTSQLNRSALGWLDTASGSSTVTSESRAGFRMSQDENAIAWSNSGIDTDTSSDAAAGDETFSTLVSLTSAGRLSDQLNLEQLEYLQSEEGREDLIALLRAQALDGPSTGDLMADTGYMAVY